jgi:hypothetical protein
MRIKIAAVLTLVGASFMFTLTPAQAEEVPTVTAGIVDCDADEVDLDWYKAACQPADEVDVFSTDDVNCKTDSVETTVETWTTPWSWDDEAGDFLPGEDIVTEEVTTRDATNTECPPAPKPASKVVEPVVVEPKVVEPVADIPEVETDLPPVRAVAGHWVAV